MAANFKWGEPWWVNVKLHKLCGDDACSVYYIFYTSVWNTWVLQCLHSETLRRINTCGKFR